MAVLKGVCLLYVVFLCSIQNRLLGFPLAKGYWLRHGLLAQKRHIGVAKPEEAASGQLLKYALLNIVA